MKETGGNPEVGPMSARSFDQIRDRGLSRRGGITFHNKERERRNHGPLGASASALNGCVPGRPRRGMTVWLLGIPCRPRAPAALARFRLRRQGSLEQGRDWQQQRQDQQQQRSQLMTECAPPCYVPSHLGNSLCKPSIGQQGYRTYSTKTKATLKTHFTVGTVSRKGRRFPFWVAQAASRSTRPR